MSATKVRKAEFGNGWVKPAKGEWVPLDEGPVHGRRNPVLNIDAGPVGAAGFFLATGGTPRTRRRSSAS